MDYLSSSVQKNGCLLSLGLVDVTFSCGMCSVNAPAKKVSISNGLFIADHPMHIDTFSVLPCPQLIANLEACLSTKASHVWRVKSLSVKHPSNNPECVLGSKYGPLEGPNRPFWSGKTLANQTAVKQKSLSPKWMVLHQFAGLVVRVRRLN